MNKCFHFRRFHIQIRLLLPLMGLFLSLTLTFYVVHIIDFLKRRVPLLSKCLQHCICNIRSFRLFSLYRLISYVQFVYFLFGAQAFLAPSFFAGNQFTENIFYWEWFYFSLPDSPPVPYALYTASISEYILWAIYTWLQLFKLSVEALTGLALQYTLCCQS